MRRRYEKIDRESYGPQYGDDDFAYTWDWFQNVAALFQKAAASDRALSSLSVSNGHQLIYCRPAIADFTRAIHAMTCGRHRCQAWRASWRTAVLSMRP